MVLNNTCQCNACANISSLDLKFFVHYGAFGLQRLGGHDELVGSDVNLIHRLLKNQVTEELGVRAYTLYSDAAIKQLNLERFCEQLVVHHESYEHLGKVEVWVQDMHPVWERLRSATRVTIPPDQLALRVEGEIALPAELVWDCPTQPEYRSILMGSDRQIVLNRKDGRIAPGSVYQCFHGDNVLTQTILDWQPVVRMLSEDLIMPKITVLVECQLIPTETGVRLVQTISKARGPLPMRMVVNMAMKTKAKEAERDIRAFLDRIAADHAAYGQDDPATRFRSDEISLAAAASLSPA